MEGDALFGPVRIRDDRGVDVALFDERSAHGRDDQDAMLEVMKASRWWGVNLSIWHVTAIVGSMLSMFAAFLVCEYYLKVTSTPVKWGVYIGVAFVATSWEDAVRRRGTAKRVRATLLKMRRCASCGYSLEGLSVEGDGRVVCAECGGAWLCTSGDR